MLSDRLITRNTARAVKSESEESHRCSDHVKPVVYIPRLLPSRTNQSILQFSRYMGVGEPDHCAEDKEDADELSE